MIFKEKEARALGPGLLTSSSLYSLKCMPPDSNFSLRADRFIKFELSLIAYPDNNGTLKWVALFGEGHLAGNTVEFLDLGQGVTLIVA